MHFLELTGRFCKRLPRIDQVQEGLKVPKGWYLYPYFFHVLEWILSVRLILQNFLGLLKL